ncbi:MAG: SIS domain-containing protein [Bacteroidales bacterium]|nr:SIS domain-containing protein [Bacteroidales bacterium]MCF8328541.1 SIS domain-containing protein [Bacteroidales bacterium]
MDIKQTIKASINTKEKLFHDEVLLEKIEMAAQKMVECFKQDQKVLLCGNGGSAADAQHIAAELSGKFYHDREPLYAEALHVNTSYLTAVANDYSFEDVYARMLKAAGRKGDILIGFSTSGNSENIVRALKTGKEQGMFTIALTGNTGGRLSEIVELLINVPDNDTPRIQEAHGLIGHILCQWVEEVLFSNKADN